MKIATQKNTEASACTLDAMPEHQQDAMARTLISCIGRLFEDANVRADYERWKQHKLEKTTPS